MKTLLRRILKLEDVRTPASILPPPRMIPSFVHAAPPVIGGGPRDFGIVRGVEGCFIRKPEESEREFLEHLAKLVPTDQVDPRIDIYDEATLPGWRVG